mmetsp:Transcript_51807/g.165849  ORF Transcript_51807/g.165849 Transcript_51807/m.165849 type:complete len:400 (-) Transcript_51807:221-1420(-)
MRNRSFSARKSERIFVVISARSRSMVARRARSTRIISSSRSFSSTKVVSVRTFSSSTRALMALSFATMSCLVLSKRWSVLSERADTFSSVCRSSSARVASSCCLAASTAASRSEFNLASSSSMRLQFCCRSSFTLWISCCSAACASSSAALSCASVSARVARTSANSAVMRSSASSSVFRQSSASTLTLSRRWSSSPCLCSTPRLSSRLDVICSCRFASTSLSCLISMFTSSNWLSTRLPRVSSRSKSSCRPELSAASTLARSCRTTSSSCNVAASAFTRSSTWSCRAFAACSWLLWSSRWVMPRFRLNSSRLAASFRPSSSMARSRRLFSACTLVFTSSSCSILSRGRRPRCLGPARSCAKLACESCTSTEGSRVCCGLARKSTSCLSVWIGTRRGPS